MILSAVGETAKCSEAALAAAGKAAPIAADDPERWLSVIMEWTVPNWPLWAAEPQSRMLLDYRYQRSMARSPIDLW